MTAFIRPLMLEQACIEWEGVSRSPAGFACLWRDGRELFAVLGPLYITWTPTSSRPRQRQQLNWRGG